MGLAGFYRQLIPHFANISGPLNALTSDNVHFKWTEECEIAFNTLGEKLSSESVLSFPRIREPFVVEVDASDYAIGGVLSQMGGEEMHWSLPNKTGASIAKKPTLYC